MSLFNGIKWPYATMQQLNLDWILTEIKRIMGFFPEEGNTGTVLMKTDDGAAWEELPAIDININGVPEDTELTDTDKLIFYDVSSSANRKITAPNLLNSMMSNGTPLMDGTGSAGTSKKPARYDHRHPTDTSRQAALSGAQMAAVNSGAPANAFQNNALKIENGGTGATTAQQARQNLGVDNIKSIAVAPGETWSLTIRRGMVFAFRASVTANPCVWLLDQWSGITAIRESTTLATITDANGNVVVTNTSSSYIDIAEIDFGF